jgi:penicillin-binding protein 2
VFPVVLLSGIFLVLIFALVDLQVVKGEEFALRSQSNQYEIVYETPYRGVILDRNGKKLAENAPSVNVFIDLKEYRDVYGVLDEDELGKIMDRLDQLLGNEVKVIGEGGESYRSLREKLFKAIEEIDPQDLPYVGRINIISGASNDDVVLIKSRAEELPGIHADNSSERKYLGGPAFSHILGYTGDVYAEDLENLDYVGPTDVIGKSGIEKLYDERLFGVKGQTAREVDAFGNLVSDNEAILSAPVSGDSLYLTIDSTVQKKAYEILAKGVKKYRASGGAVVLEDVKTGELISLASYPSFDNNDFIGGISQKQFSKLVNDERAPLTNKAIGAQVPPGSVFKTIVASAALDAGVITRDTKFLSRSDYTFSDGSEFQEFHDKAYGWLNLIDAISVSSNIYFCETIRRWDMDELVPYLESFGIGEYTYVDIPGEGPGRLPSPANKIELARSGFTWLEDVWYPEGDSCNSVIGQGITTVTPIQMANWIAAIANGGILQNPHVAKKFVSPDGTEEAEQFDPLGTVLAGKSALATVREGMRASVSGPRRVIFPLTDAKVAVAGKTGTAEFGKVNKDGSYEHTHAWVTGFFPYDKPKYSFVIFLEDGGESNNASILAREFIDWFAEYSSKK